MGSIDFAEAAAGSGIVADELDQAIVRALSRDGRRPYGEIARALGVPEATVRYRVRRMRDAGALRILAVLDPVVAGQRAAQVQIRTSGSVSAVAALLAAIDSIEYVVITSGAADILCEIVVPGDRELLKVIEQIREVPGVIGTESLVYLHIEKVAFGSQLSSAAE